MDDSTASSTISSTTTPSIVMPTFTIAKASRPTPGVTGGSLCRMKSGSSVVLDTIDGIETESRKLPSSKYKGVVPQPNGRWGAQIYEKHQRVWLGTFNEENDAARAYDIAAQRFRSRDAVTNFKPLSATGSVDGDDRIEINFLTCHSKAEIVDMLRKHTYDDELEQSKKSFKLNRRGYNNIDGRPDGKGADGLHGWADKAPEQLFEKVVTPSDVGKLNRLVIPKQHAEKHFPLQAGGDTLKGVLLNFADAHEKVWRFRYSYWNSSQSYVFTKGWSRFVKEKDLKAGDIVSFHRSNGPEENQQLYIDWRGKPKNGVNGSSSVVVGCNGFISSVVKSVHIPHPPPTTIAAVAPPMFRLFGVNISSSGNGGGGGGGGGGVVENGISSGCSGGKRMREMELFSLLESSASCKKHMVVGGSI